MKENSSKNSKTKILFILSVLAFFMSLIPVGVIYLIVVIGVSLITMLLTILNRKTDKTKWNLATLMFSVVGLVDSVGFLLFILI